jgi:tRNA(fMet)-specific endonuclease VapC
VLVAARRQSTRIAGDLRTNGRRAAAHAFVALIAATALANGLPLYTANTRNFAGITGLDVRDVQITEGSGSRGWRCCGSARGT